MRVAVILILIILFSGCVSNERLVNNEMSADNEMSVDNENDNVEVNDDSDPDLDDLTDTENSDGDVEEVIPKCLNQWEEVKTTDIDSFEFKLKKTTGLWSWKKDGDMEVLDYDGETNLVDITKNGELIVAESSETETGYSVLAYLKADGSYEKFEFEFDKGKTINYEGYDTKDYLRAYATYSENLNEIYVVVNMRDKNNVQKPFLMKINNNREVSYISFDVDGNPVCEIEMINDIPLVLCQSWTETGEDNIPYEEHLEMYTLVNGKMLKQSIGEGKEIVLNRAYMSGDRLFLDVYEMSLTSSYIAVDEGLCLDYSNLGEYFFSDYFRLKKELEASNLYPLKDFNYIDGTFSQAVYSAGELNEINGDFSYFNFGDREIIFSLYEEKPDDDVISFNFFYGGYSSPEDENIFKSGSSTIDLEDKGRDWTDERCRNKKVYLEYVDPLEKKIYVRHFIKDGSDCYAGPLFITDKHILYQTTSSFNEKNEKIPNRLFRMKKGWLIDPEYEVKDKFLKIEEKTTARERMNEVAMISAGGIHTCSINTDAHLFCWGDNTEEQQGEGWGKIFEGDVTRIANNFPGPVDRSAVLKDRKIISLSSGYQHSCAADDNGVVYCWGDNDRDQLGNGLFTGKFTPRLAVIEGEMLDRDIVKVDVGERSSCALDSTGVAYCWGSNLYGQLGLGKTNVYVSDKPRSIYMDDVLKDKILVDVAVGAKHACALDNQGMVYCWGDNNYNQVGNGEENDIESTWNDFEQSPVSVIWNGLPPKIIEISAGSNHTCGLDDNGSVYCWGLNTQDQLGNYSENTKSNPVKLNFEEKFIDISAGFEHTCGVTDKHDVYCWGSNAEGQLGNDSMENSNRPVKVSFDSNRQINSVSCGYHHTCAVDADGNTYCWGQNNDGQLGNRTYVDSSKPVLVK